MRRNRACDRHGASRSGPAYRRNMAANRTVAAMRQLNPSGKRIRPNVKNFSEPSPRMPISKMIAGTNR